MSLFTNVKKYRGTVFEVIVIVFGVMLSFLLNEIRLGIEDKDEAISILKQIKTDLEKDLYDTKINLQVEDSASVKFDFLIRTIENRIEYSENLDAEFSYLSENSFLLPSKTGLQILNSKGVDFIKNDSLRVKFLTLHNYIYQERLGHFNIFNFNLQRMNQFVAENFHQTIEMYSKFELKPNDYNSLLDNTYFKNLLFSCMEGHNNLFYVDSLIKVEILDLLPLLDKEIAKLQ